MGTDYSQNSAEVVSLRDCALVVFKKMSEDSYNNVLQACREWVDANREYIDDVEGCLASLEESRYEEDIALANNDRYPDLLEWALDLYNDIRCEVDEEGEICASFWNLLIANCGQDQFKPFANVNVYYFNDDTYTKELDGMSWEEPYIEFQVPLHERVLTKEAKELVEVFGEDNFPCESSWITVSF